MLFFSVLFITIHSIAAYDCALRNDTNVGFIINAAIIVVDFCNELHHSCILCPMAHVIVVKAYFDIIFFTFTQLGILKFVDLVQLRHRLLCLKRITMNYRITCKKCLICMYKYMILDKNILSVFIVPIPTLNQCASQYMA